MVNIEALKETMERILVKKQVELAGMEKDGLTHEIGYAILEEEIHDVEYVLEGFPCIFTMKFFHAALVKFFHIV